MYRDRAKTNLVRGKITTLMITKDQHALIKKISSITGIPMGCIAEHCIKKHLKSLDQDYARIFMIDPILTDSETKNLEQ